jgi:hypothetical protein
MACFKRQACERFASFSGIGLVTHDDLCGLRVGALFQLIRCVRLRGEPIHEGMAWHT